MFSLSRLFLMCCALLFSDLKAEERETDTMTNGWYYWDPYQYTQTTEAGSLLTGLDIELTRAIAKAAGKRVIYDPVSWKEHQEQLRNGTRDFASGATYTKERADFVYFSNPYRYEEDSLFIPRGQEELYNFQDLEGFLKLVKDKNLRIGIVEGYVYASEKLNAWLKDPKNAPHIVMEHSDDKNINNVLNKKIDGFISDRIVGATLIWRSDLGDQINEIRLNISSPIHFMFSKKSVSPQTVKEFNEAIGVAQNTDKYQNIVSAYLHPLLLLQTVDTTWFRIVEIIGIISFAISGLVIAYRDKSTMFGAMIFATLPSLGGGIIRDLIFDRKPVGAMETPLYLYLVISTVLIGYLTIRLYQKYFKVLFHKLVNFGFDQKKIAQNVLMMTDAIGLSAFTVSGIIVSVMAKAQPLWLWGPFFAFLTGAGGSIMRDLLSRKRDIVSLRGDIYPEIAVTWGLFLSLFLTFWQQNLNPDHIRYAVIVTVIGAFISRIAVYYFDVRNVFFRK